MKKEKSLTKMVNNCQSIHFNTVCNYLREFYGKPRKIVKHFIYLKNKWWQQKKFEKSLVIEGCISFYGVGKLVFLNGMMNDFAYGQTLMFYKDDVDSIRDKYNKKLIIEQDGANCHKSKMNPNY